MKQSLLLTSMMLAMALSPIASATTTPTSNAPGFRNAGNALAVREAIDNRRMQFRDAGQMDLGPGADQRSVSLLAPKNTSAAGFCDYWPESCVTVCETTLGTSPLCSLRPNWLPIAPSYSPFAYIGSAHNEGLAGVAARAPAGGMADSSLASSYVTWLSADALCNGAAPSLANDPSWNATFGSSALSRDECMVRAAGIATKAIYSFRSAMAIDGYGSDLAAGYGAAFRDLGALNQKQLDAMSRLYALLPNESRIEEVPLLFGRIDAFERDTKQRLSPQDAEVVLRTSAVMRASLQYWLDEAEGPTTWPAIKGVESEPVTERRKGLWRRILRLVAADAAGCLGGSVVFGVPGCVIGAVGASAGAGSNL